MTTTTATTATARSRARQPGTGGPERAARVPPEGDRTVQVEGVAVCGSHEHHTMPLHIVLDEVTASEHR